MYLGKKKLNDPAEYERNRERNIAVKSSATWLAFFEMDGIINKTQLAEQYFNRTHGWLSQKLHGCEVLGRQKAFTEAEYHQLAEHFRDIARRLMAHADEIDAAKMDTDD